MKHRKCSILILVIAFLIIGMREVCMAQYSQHVSIEKSDTQEWNDVQVAIPINKSFDFVVLGGLRFGRDVTRLVDERIGGGFTARVKRYVYVAPSYQYIGMQPTAGRKIYEHRLSLATTFRLPFERFVVSDRSVFERRIRSPQIDASRYRNRFQVERPIRLAGLDLQGFVSDEVFYDWSVRRWVRNRFYAGVSKRLSRHFAQDFYYMRQNDGFARPGDLNVLGTALRVRL